MDDKIIEESMKILGLFAKVFVPLIATFLGAFLAFLFQNRREQNNEVKKNYSICLKTQSLFYQYCGVIYSIDKDFLKEFKDDQQCAQKVKHISFCKSFPELDYESLSFILANKENVDLYNDIVNAYRKCLSAVESIEERNELYRKVLEGDVNGVDMRKSKLSLSPKPADCILLKDFTDIMYREVGQVLERINEIDVKLQTFIKSNFKGKYALKMRGIKD